MSQTTTNVNEEHWLVDTLRVNFCVMQQNCRAVQSSHKEAALNEHLNNLQVKFGPMRFRVQQVWAKHYLQQSQVWEAAALKASLVQGVEESDHCVLFGCGFESKCFANLWLEG